MTPCTACGAPVVIARSLVGIDSAMVPAPPLPKGERRRDEEFTVDDRGVFETVRKGDVGPFYVFHRCKGGKR